MAKQYDAYEHIAAVSAASESLRGLTVGVGRAVYGTDILPRSWARVAEREKLKGFMSVLCMIDLGYAFPVDPDMLDDSMRHLALADEAFATEGHPDRNEYEDQYRQFDEGVGPFYQEYAHALGGRANKQKINKANESIDIVVRHGIERLNRGETHAIIFPSLVETLAINREAVLVPPSSD